MTLSLPNKAWLKNLIIAGSTMLLMALFMVLFADKAFAHGYVDSPGSRAILCKQGQNTDCGAIVYEPQSLEAPKGWPNAGPADGKIASAGGVFPKLDEQSATRWSKVSITPGTKTFQWHLTANHATASWKYYITKDGWNQNAPLSRASFDLTPFCSIDYGGAKPPTNYASTCNVPAKSGYHVILAVWEVADTPNAFYNAIDVDFGGGGGTPNPGVPAPTGLTSPSQTSSSVSLAWTASTGASSYEIYRNGTLVGTSTTTSYNNTGLTAGTSYTYTVVAVNSSGSKSTASAPLTVSTSGGSTAYPAWSATAVYVGGNKVSHNGVNYEAKWWTQGETPGSAEVWKVIP
ncbi:chitin-binding protein [Paenibacillus glucanolyticus]|uniref:lytic polysaccharide monooxygenase n=1 Tax=Paenibacillus TaxID=44249 RepID=UPI0003E29AFF|nr:MULTISPECIES: lytic polysaccharide monooxygenase [Paenibacillus]ANA80841.1 chitin-binding protein [Paenibacillus glucanolyticus]AVV55087.1 chitin-binding protein [Paenibacillus glucanolyticus]ETT40550.1 chitin-binding domain 3 protein [Paenibacillus sp. FSL R5-808]OMF81549.1 chitin-binding protein [Paenibacillus glucanolyticus]